jgi:hypothetical protein
MRSGASTSTTSSATPSLGCPPVQSFGVAISTVADERYGAADAASRWCNAAPRCPAAGQLAVVEPERLDQANVGAERLGDAGDLDGPAADGQRPFLHRAWRVVSLRPVKDRAAGIAGQSVSILRSSGGISSALADAPAACRAWAAAAGWANGTTTGSQMVPLDGTREVRK